MPLVIVEHDTKYRREGTQYLEICRTCGRDRAGEGTCACGAAFELERGSTQTTFQLTLPNVCPHCGGAATHARGLATQRPGETVFRMRTCSRVPPPFAALVASAFCFTAAIAGSMFRTAGGFSFAALALFGAVASWRAYTWVRVVRADRRSFRFRVRRADYAFAVADLNGGRVVGSLRASGSPADAFPNAKVVR